MAVNVFLDLPNGVKMPILGLGTWQATDEKELENALNAALEIGYRHIDTATVYGNEHVVGRVLKQWFTSGKLKRKDVFITTKLPPFGIHPDTVELYLKKSLANLQLDYVDLYLIHMPIGVQYSEGIDKKPFTEWKAYPKTDHIGVWRKLEEQVDAGRTKAIGLSNFSVKQLDNVYQSARIKPANLQIELHVYHQQNELVDYCHSHGITVVSYSSLGNPSYEDFLKNANLPPQTFPRLMEDPVVVKVAKKHSKTPAQILLRFLVQKKIAVIPKSVSPERLKQNISIFDFELDADDMKALTALDKGDAGRFFWHRFPGWEQHPDYPFRL